MSEENKPLEILFDEPKIPKKNIEDEETIEFPDWDLEPPFDAIDRSVIE